jgi:protein-L-isoaspartate(D-aspartate) O-methyltransferase
LDNNNNNNKDEFYRHRRRMVEEQLKARGIADPGVLAAMLKVPRHLFTDEAVSSHAYHDGPLPIGHGQTISQPYIVALMTEVLGLKPEDKVLEIGFGCGYQTAILSVLAKKVCAVERLSALFDKGRENLIRLGIKNVTLKLADGMLGWPEEAPFEAILVAAYGRSVPEALREELAPGGRLVMPVGDFGSQKLMLYSKAASGRVSGKIITGCRFVPLRSDVK